MSLLESLKPQTNQKVMDLVASAGGDVQRWAVSRNGPVQYPASNPAYCYEWAFVETGFVVLNVWHDQIEETGAFGATPPERLATSPSTI